MKARELKPIFSVLKQHFPGFVGHKRLLLQAPMNGFIRAIHFDTSAYDKHSFYPSWLVLPLCFPRDYVVLSPGDRLRHKQHGEFWSVNDPDMMPDLIEAIATQAMPVFVRSNTIEGFVQIARKFWGNPHIPKYAAFALARAGCYEQAIATIDELIPTIRPLRDWEQEIIDKVTFLRDLIVKDPAALQEQLAEWEDLSIKNLRLEAFR